MPTEKTKLLLLEIERRKPYVPEYSKWVPERIIECKVSDPVSWKQAAIETGLSVTLPADLVDLWEAAGEIRLYDDVNYGQWGCILWSPSQILARHKEGLGWRDPDDFRPGDLIIGEFRGDAELVVVRCDRQESDFGSVVIALEMDPRSDWPVVGASICEFIEKYLASPGKKYWDPAG